MDKGGVLYLYTMESYSAMRKKKFLPFATTMMVHEGIVLSEISQKKDNYCMILLICGLIKKKFVETENGMGVWELGRCLSKGRDLQLEDE